MPVRSVVAQEPVLLNGAQETCSQPLHRSITYSLKANTTSVGSSKTTAKLCPNRPHVTKANTYREQTPAASRRWFCTAILRGTREFGHPLLEVQAVNCFAPPAAQNIVYHNMP